jgi:hypothetical protein
LGGSIQLKAIIVNIIYSIIGGFLTLFFMYVGYRIVDKFTDFNTSKELAKDKRAVGMVVLGINEIKKKNPSLIDIDEPRWNIAAGIYYDHQLYRKFKPKELDDVHLLYLHAHGPDLLHSKKPVRTMANAKGMKIRSTGFSAKVAKALGGVPVAMGQGGAYEALQKGVVEGTLSPLRS